MKNAQTGLRSSRPLDRADFRPGRIQSGMNVNRNKSDRSQLRSLLRNNACSTNRCKKNNNGRQGNKSKDVIFVPVSCKHADNFDFHTSLTSARSHVNGALDC